MNLLKHLERVRAKLTPPGSWTTRVYARDSAGDEVAVDSPDATCFCLLGASMSVSASDASMRVEMSKALLRVVGKSINSGDHVADDINDIDGQTQEGVLAILDKAIAAERGTAR